METSSLVFLGSMLGGFLGSLVGKEVTTRHMAVLTEVVTKLEEMFTSHLAEYHEKRK